MNVNLLRDKLADHWFGSMLWIAVLDISILGTNIIKIEWQTTLRDLPYTWRIETKNLKGPIDETAKEIYEQINNRMKAIILIR